MEKQHSLKGTLKYLFVPLVLLSLFSFVNNTQAESASAAPTIITTKASETYINDYYSSISSSLTGSGLASALETRLKQERNNSFSYGSLQSTAFPYTDVDPTRPNDGYIVSFYSGVAVKGYSGMNKEHTWPNSHGGNKIENDPHMVRPTISSENSSRGNEYFSNTAAGWDPASLGDIQARGMAARIALYGAVIGKSSGLVLEDVGRGQGTGTGNKMGKLGDLLKWNLDYPVNQKEIIRNETLDISLSYNRNPFIDRPEYACRIWGDTNANTKAICSAFATPTITLDKTTADVNIGSTTKITATVKNSSSTVAWFSSNPAIASVNASTGLVTGNAKGTATITAKITDNSVSYTATCVVAVKDPNDVSVTGIVLNNTSASILVGDTTSLTANILPSNSTINTINWTTSNSAIASISSTTNKTITVTGVARGSATITATTDDGGFKATCNVIVTSNLVGETTDGLTYSDFGLSAKYNDYSYTSPDSGASYEVHAYLGSGNTIQMNGDKNAGFVITASAGKLKSVTVNWSLTTSSGRGIDLYGSNTAYTSTVSSAISSTTSLGSLIYGSGSNTYTFSSDYSYFGFVSKTKAIYFTSIQIVWAGATSSPTLSSISISANPAKTAYLAGETLDLTGLVVNANYSDASVEPNISDYTTSPSEGDILNTIGTQVVTVYYKTKTTSFNVMVTAQNFPLVSVSLNITSATLDVGGTLSLKPTLNPINAHPAPSITWESSNPLLVNVSNGLVTALESGSATITVTATQGSIIETDICQITVTNSPFVPTTTYTEGGGVSTTATLTTNLSTLEIGDKIIIAASAENYVMSTTQNDSNRASIETTKSGNEIANVDASTMQIITLEAGTKADTFAFNVGDGYLYAASSSSNHLKTQATKDDNASFTISITSAGVATVKAQGKNTRNQLKFNTGNKPKLFSCYSSGQTPISIYEMQSEGITAYNYDYLIDVLDGDYCTMNLAELDLINVRYEAMNLAEKNHFKSVNIVGKDGNNYTGEQAYNIAMIKRASLGGLTNKNPFNDTFEQNEIVLVIVIISLIAVSAIAGSLFIFKRKRNKNN